MSEHERNGKLPAHPVSLETTSNGLSKREEIASRVLAGICANSLEEVWNQGPTVWAKTAVKAADALLKHLAEG